MKYVHYDKADRILGFYGEDDPNIPEPTVQITDEQWMLCFPNPRVWRVGHEEEPLIEVGEPSPTTSELISDGTVRVRTITLRARSQAAEYADQYRLAGWNDKAQRAARILSGTADAIDIGIIQAEIERRAEGETAEQLAQKQIDKAVALATAVSVIDGLESATLQKLPMAVADSGVEGLLENLEQNLVDHLENVEVPS